MVRLTLKSGASSASCQHCDVLTQFNNETKAKMPKYKIKRIYQYTTTEEVEADSEQGAIDMVPSGKETDNHDDVWIDSQIID